MQESVSSIEDAECKTEWSWLPTSLCNDRKVVTIVEQFETPGFTCQEDHEGQLWPLGMDKSSVGHIPLGRELTWETANDGVRRLATLNHRQRPALQKALLSIHWFPRFFMRHCSPSPRLSIIVNGDFYSFLLNFLPCIGKCCPAVLECIINKIGCALMSVNPTNREEFDRVTRELDARNICGRSRPVGRLVH